MNYELIKDIISLVESFDKNRQDNYSSDIEGFCQWIVDTKSPTIQSDVDWEGKSKGRSVESVISTLLVHMNKYAKSYSKSAIHNSLFSTQDEFIFLINLKAFGSMSKTELIRLNKMDKPTGIQIINRLIKYGWANQVSSQTDKRSKMLEITEAGNAYLGFKMDDIRKATKVVSADLTANEKIQLVRILTKMDKFHQKIYSENIGADKLLEKAFQNYKTANSLK